MSLKLLAKKHADRVIEYLKENGESYFGQIKNDLNIEQSTLSKLLTELVEENFIIKREEKEGYKLPKTYYKLTELGYGALNVYREYTELEKLKKITNQTNIKGKVGKVINVSGDNTTLNIK
jgi:DNA-binding HxlR family transcriptional regulator